MVSFPTTQWCSVTEAGNPDSAAGVAARADLCRQYWYPIYPPSSGSDDDIVRHSELKSPPP